MLYFFSLNQVSCFRLKELSALENTGFEIRLDSFSEAPDFAALRAATKRPLLATFRSLPHLGVATPEKRNGVGWLWRLRCLAAGFEWIDLELDEPDLAAKIERIQEHGARVVLSHHELRKSDTLLERLAVALDSGADLIKIIGTGTSVADFRTQRQLYERAGTRPLIHFFMGGEFAATRVCSLLYGAPFTFVALEGQTPLAPGQLSYQQMWETYKPLGLSMDQTAFFAVIGAPIGHSRSPRFHNPRLKARAANSLFLALPCESRADLAILREVFGGLRAVAVTKPMKEIAFELAEAFMDPNSARLGAVNTLVFSQGRMKGGNTDLLAMMALLEGVDRQSLVRVLGFGGLGKAVLEACRALNLPTEICNRNPERLRLMDGYARILPWEERHREGAQVLVQATSVGMMPNPKASPLDHVPDSVTKLIETIYNPLETKLMQLCSGKNIQVTDGLALFDAQAAIQNRLLLECLGTHSA